MFHCLRRFIFPSIYMSNKERDKTHGKEDKIFTLSEEEFREPLEDDYLQSISELSPAELYGNYNPGPTKADGSVNFECHCVGHLVASPCGYEFRQAITCQKSATEAEMENGACADEFISFMQCVMRTECFKSRRTQETPGEGHPNDNNAAAVSNQATQDSFANELGELKS
ncbi:hypothetical protein AB6A40_000522 [Gnathostoma spinigerum]|uniref:CHCH domain-containing protein n=1 Tax=Gnathostoma spinigerum TaxID=75299 RepID=A0ABD6EAN4_9BILA